MRESKKPLSIEEKLASLGEMARRIFFLIKERPGIQIMEVMRLAGLASSTTVRFHLDKLRGQDLVKEISDGHFKRLFVVGDRDYWLNPVISRFSRPMPRRIAELLLDSPMSQGEISRRLDCLPQALSYHLKHMMASGDLEERHEGRYGIYWLADPELVRTALAAGHIQVELQEAVSPAEPQVDDVLRTDPPKSD